MPPQMITLGIVIDEGVPARFANRLVKALEAPEWEIRMVNDRVPLDSAGTIPLDDLARRYRDHHDSDIVVVITDLPLWRHGTPLIAHCRTDHRVALVSLPALGALRVRQRLCEVVVPLVTLLTGNDATLPRRIGVYRTPIHHSSPDPQHHDHYLALPGAGGRLQMLFGMVQANRPWRLVPSLQGATATAIAAGTLSIFYTFIWKMAISLPPERLALISVLAFGGMVTWFICYNQLWDRSRGDHGASEAVLFNASTVLTLTLGVAVMYVALCAVITVAALAVIDGRYLQSELGYPAGVSEYAHIVWLASSMGIIAGALGSSFDSENAIRHAACSRRELERRVKLDQRQDQMT
ncbi:hypothetical protein CQY20_06940 [Mycolicibacterium agri]|uniref:5,10-methylene-tetrahydrofolate dehydrogenase n=2 Tax=Mycolicibacterium agri TaxID=36811 RepID=A0A2A7NA11_MYCAG|nr:hypothetical protein CQY20_06940 [Mycolicibacterium agri]GFG50409.1 hypothetical protein MAGR_18500 [Mycolicibacterium agri]